MSRNTPATRRSKITRLLIIIFGIIAATVALAACTSGSSANSRDQNATNDLHDRLNKNQPIPSPDFSQYRQTLIDVENAEITGVVTTTFFYNMGSNVPIKSCPSIGYPVPSTGQLTSPDQAVWGTGGSAVVAQMEPNGVYTGGSSGTYVVCVAHDGTKSPSYWEGDVETEPGPAHFDTATQQVVLDKANVIAKDQGSAGH